jgi:hypothetical protein
VDGKGWIGEEWIQVPGSNFLMTWISLRPISVIRVTSALSASGLLFGFTSPDHPDCFDPQFPHLQLPFATWQMND